MSNCKLSYSVELLVGEGITEHSKSQWLWLINDRRLNSECT